MRKNICDCQPPWGVKEDLLNLVGTQPTSSLLIIVDVLKILDPCKSICNVNTFNLKSNDDIYMKPEKYPLSTKLCLINATLN